MSNDHSSELPEFRRQFGTHVAPGALLFYKRIVHVIGAIEARQVAPAAARINAILDDIKDVTSNDGAAS